MRIVLLGPPGSGKGTQAALLKEQLKVPHISTGALLRDAAERGTQLGLQAKAMSDKGELVPDDVISGMLEERLSEADVANGFILDGYPRNLAQAKSLDILLARLKQPVDEAVHIDIDAEQIVKRIAKRAKKKAARMILKKPCGTACGFMQNRRHRWPIITTSKDCSPGFG